MNTDLHRKILINGPFGYAYHKIILDKKEKAVDYKFIEINSKFEEITGLNGKIILNKKVTEINFDISEDGFDWIEFYSKVGIDQIEQEYEFYSKKLKSWYKVQVYSPEKYYFVTIFIEITNYKKADEEFYLLKEAIEISSDAIGISTSDGISLYQNNAFGDLFNKAINRNPEKLYVDLKVCKEMFDTIKSGGEWSGEVKMYSKDNSILDIFLRAYPIKDKSGKIIGLVGLHTDITERKKSEKALKEAEVIYRTLINTSPDGITVIDINSNLTFVSPRTIEMLGYNSPEEAVGHSIFEFLALNDHEAAKQNIKLLLENKLLNANQYTFIKKNGIPITLEVNSTVIYDDNGKPNGMMSILRDITARRKAEDELKFQADILDQIGDMVTATDLEGKIIYVNNAESKILGLTKEQIIGKPTTIYGEDTRRGATQKDIVEKTLENGYWEGEIINYDKDGKELIVFCRTWQIKNRSGDVFALCGVATNITDRKQIELEKEKLIQELEKSNLTLEQALNKAEESNRLKSEFLAIMSHELRTPLTGMLGFSELLSRSDDLKDEHKKYSTFIHQAGTRLLNTLNDLLHLSIIEAGRFTLEYTYFDINELINDVYILFREKFLSKKIEFKVNTGELKLITSDLSRIRQVLLNLIGNAIKFTDKGYISIQVSIHNDNYLFEVADTGIGVSNEYKDFIFDKFSQVESHLKRKHQGAGLGLSICKKLIEALGGRIWVESKPGKGSNFKFTIPLLAIKSAGLSEKNVKEFKKMDNINVLFAEDDYMNNELIESILIASGIKCKGFLTGKDLVDELHNNNEYDVIILDIHMPDMNGYECIKEIKALLPSIPVIAITAFAMTSDKDKCFKAGFADYISKPFTTDALIGIIKKYIVMK